VLHPVMRAILVVGVLMLGATEASAKKFRFFHVGGGGHSEEIVKVLDLPDIPQLRRADGRHIDLGYKFTSGGGEWVGYVGDDGKYLALSEDAVQMLLVVAGVDRMPPVPERPASTGGGGGLTTILMLLGFGVILYRVYSFFAGAARRVVGSFAGEKAEAAGEVPNPYQAVSDPLPASPTRPVSFAKPAAAVAGAARSGSFGASSIPARGFGRRT
jgi:hypothetical protein